MQAWRTESDRWWCCWRSKSDERYCVRDSAESQQSHSHYTIRIILIVFYLLHLWWTVFFSNKNNFRTNLTNGKTSASHSLPVATQECGGRGQSVWGSRDGSHPTGSTGRAPVGAWGGEDSASLSPPQLLLSNASDLHESQDPILLGLGPADPPPRGDANVLYSFLA